mgnify:CR=1 FL=1
MSYVRVWKACKTLVVILTVNHNRNYLFLLHPCVLSSCHFRLSRISVFLRSVEPCNVVLCTPHRPLCLTLAPRAPIRHSSNNSVGDDYASLTTVYLTPRLHHIVGPAPCSLTGLHFGQAWYICVLYIKLQRLHF